LVSTLETTPSSAVAMMTKRRAHDEGVEGGLFKKKFIEINAKSPH
jgi:hypothetical protein